MKSIFIFLLTIIFNAGLMAQDNPFMKMAGKKYADISYDINNLCDQYGTDTISLQKAVDLLNEVAEKTGDKMWKMEATALAYALLHGKNEFKKDYDVEEELRINFNIIEEAQKENLPQYELRARLNIIDTYLYTIKNYELAFEQCAIQYKRLEEISTDDIPEKAVFYVEIADIHYFFRDYPYAISCFNKILEEKDNKSNQWAKQSARNGLGLCYQDAYNDLDSSDRYFHSIMQANYSNFNEEYFHKVWKGIAEGNLGYNMLLRGEYDQAVPLLKSSFETMTILKDLAFASGAALNLADIYIRKSNLSEAKHYIDLAREYNTAMPREGRLSRIYELLNKYYAAAGNANLSMAYMDSTLAENKRYEKQFSAMTLLRIEQKESAQRLQELAHEKEIRKQIQFTLVILSIGFIVVVGLLWLLLMYYRKKRTAYRELVRKSQEWAQVKAETGGANQIIEPDEKEEKQDIPPDEVNMSIMKNIEQLMLDEKLYTDPLLSVDMLANKLKMKRHYVSESINRCKNINFNTYINEYRIKEAIRLLSKKDAKEFSIDRIAFDAGFNDRINFYRIFKKITGLSPTEFRKNIGKE